LQKYISTLQEIVELGKVVGYTVFPEKIYFGKDGSIKFDEITE
jgi:hypothetical protein